MSPTLHQIRLSSIAQACQAANLSLLQLSEILCLGSEQELRDVDEGTVPLTVELLCDLSDALDQEIEFFLNPYRFSPELRKFFESGQHQARPLPLPFVIALHSALDKGQISARKAAKMVGMSLSELSAVFPANNLVQPFFL